MQEIQYSDREKIYGVGDRAEAIFSVVSGFVVLRRPNIGGATREQLIGPGAVFGAAEALAGTVRATTARAHGSAVIASHMPERIINEMIERPEAADAMVASLIATLAAADHARREDMSIIGPHTVQLVPADPAVINQMGDTPLTIDRFPFFIGRKSDTTDDDIEDPVDGSAALVLEDRRPFRLSRRHLAIDREDDQFVVRDYRSFHGTIVNGIALAVGGGGLKIQLDPGENEIIAGNADSPFRFTCIVPTLSGL